MLQQMISTNGTFLFQDDINLYPQYSNGIKLEIRTQNKSPLRLAYDINNFVDFSVGSGGALTINATGGVVISQNGNVLIKNGNVGVGTAVPVVKLDVNGEIKLGSSAMECVVTIAGTLRWYDGHISVCTGTLWRQLDNPPPPLIGSITPAFGPEATVITINGTGFAPGLQVKIGDVVATNVTCVSTTQIIATVPASATSGAKDVTITNFDTGAAVKANGFTYSVYATGGTITTSGVYRIHTFTSSDTFSVNTAGNVEFLIVGGGGGGCGAFCGGAGGGGIVHSSSYPLSSQIYTIIVGIGGTGGLGWQQIGNMDGANGGNSSAFNIIATGGGGGGAFWGGGYGGDSSDGAKAGGSGGGAAHAHLNMTCQTGAASNQQNFANTTAYGNSGGSAGIYAAGPYNGGGGGGAGSAGETGSSSNPGNGGAGLAFAISGSSIIYAGGGGGSSQGTGYGIGGLGGGGNATATTTVAQDGGTNLGGGGGAGGYDFATSARVGGNGGSGIVIIRYPITQ